MGFYNRILQQKDVLNNGPQGHPFVFQQALGASSFAVQEQEQEEKKKKKQHKQSLMELIQEAF